MPVQGTPNPRTGEPKPSYRADRLPPQWRTPISAGHNAPKRKEVELAEFREAVHNSKSRVALCDPYPSHSATPHSRTARPLPVAQCDPIIYRTSKDHPEDHNPPEAGGEMSGSFELSVARRKHLSSLPDRTALPNLSVMGHFVLAMGLTTFRHGAFCFDHGASSRRSWGVPPSIMETHLI